MSLRPTDVHDRPWLPLVAKEREREVRASVADLGSADVAVRLSELVDRNLQIHNHECVNLNPATNVMNPLAEAPRMPPSP